MISASSLSAEFSKMRRGLVADSVRTARGRSRYSVVVFGFIVALLDRVGRSGGGGADGIRPPAAEKSWLAGFRQFRFCFLHLFRSGCFKRGKNDGWTPLDNLQALGLVCRV